MPLHAGLDWGATGHAVCVLDERGTYDPERHAAAKRPA